MLNDWYGVMKKLRFYCTLWTVKGIAFGMKLLRRRASYLPGKIALKLCPDFMGHIEKPETVIAVTGTNGKTTVCNLVNDILEANGYQILNNRYGSNVNSGIASSLIAGSSLFGKTKKDIAVLEVDERSSRLIYPYVKPDYLLCTNLFRDSISRNAHTEFIRFVINSALPDTTKLILNADDLICCGIGTENHEKVYFGIERLESDTESEVDTLENLPVCPVCDSKLQYDFVRYHHIGRAHCPNCDFKSPESDYLATKIDQEAKEVSIRTKNGTETYNMINDNIINIYNMTAAIALLQEFGLPQEKIKETMATMKPVKSRFHEETIHGVTIVMQLAKGQNPIACSRAFDYIAGSDGNKAVLMNLDDHFEAHGGSENMTWIYDCNYEYLKDDSVKQIVIGGVRAQDHYVRLLLAGVEADRISQKRHETDTVDDLDFSRVDKVFILYDIYTIDMAEAVKARLIARLEQEANQ